MQYQLENERPVKSEALVCAAPPQSSIVDDLQEEIEQLKESLSESNTERSSLRSRLHEVEIQLKQTAEERYAFSSDCRCLLTSLFTCSQHGLHQLKSQMLQMKHVTDHQ